MRRMTVGVVSTTRCSLERVGQYIFAYFQRGVMAVAYQDHRVQKLKDWKTLPEGRYASARSQDLEDTTESVRMRDKIIRRASS